MRRLYFYVGYICRHWVQFIVPAPFLRSVWDTKAVATISGVKIVNHSSRLKVDEQFRADTIAALHLIQSVDPRRFKRIQREIKYIINWHILACGRYCRPIRCCYVDFDYFRDFDNVEWRLWNYSTLLIHEATHGAIYSRYINYSPALRSRIERLCHKEARRFATKSNTHERHWSDTIVPPFDENDWHDSWYLPFWKRVTRQIARVRQARRRGKTEGDPPS